jgi:hypothetical protein
MYLDEAGRPQYEPHRETWTRWAALSTILMALAAALAGVGAAAWGLKSHTAAAQERRQWSEYQTLVSRSEGVKQARDVFSLHRLLEHKNPKVQKLVEGKLQDYEEELARLEKEGEKLKAQIEEAGRQGEGKAGQAAGAARTALLLLLATVLAAAAVQAKKKLLWLAALVLTAGGLASFVGGAFRWF